MSFVPLGQAGGRVGQRVASQALAASLTRPSGPFLYFILTIHNSQTHTC